SPRHSSTTRRSCDLSLHNRISNDGKEGYHLNNSNNYKQNKILTKREKEVFEILVQDKTTKEIAEELFISEKTVRNHISNAIQKLGVKGRAQAVIELIRMGEIKL